MRFSVRWQCGSSSTPIDALGPDDGAHALHDVAFDVVIAVGDHGTVQAEHHAVERQRRLELAQDLVAHGPRSRLRGCRPGRAGAQKQLPSIRVKPSLARAAGRPRAVPVHMRGASSGASPGG